MFIGFRVTAFSGSSRKSLLSTERFFFFDLGVRNAAAELPLGAAALSLGGLFDGAGPGCYKGLFGGW